MVVLHQGKRPKAVMMKSRTVSTNTILSVLVGSLLLILSGSSLTVKAVHDIPTLAECEAAGKKIRICHATSSETNPYEDIEIACNAAYGSNGNAGHFDENGTPLSGHEDDLVPHDGQGCPGDPSPTPSVSPSPDPSVEPSPTPSVSPSPTASPTSTPGTTGGGNQEGCHTSLANDHLQCNEKSFDAVMDIKDGDTFLKDVLVRFTFNGETKEARTNEFGRARVAYGFTGNGSVYAVPENGCPSQAMYLTMPACPANASSSNSSTNSAGQVLGVSSLAFTGSPLPLMAGTLLTLGSTLAGVAVTQLRKLS